MQKHFLVCCGLAAVLLASCVTSPALQQQPANGLRVSDEVLLSSSDYIAYRGRGSSAEAAKQNAHAGISRYFSSRISVNTVEKTRVTDSGSKSVLENVTQVLSDTELFAVHYTEVRTDTAQQKFSVIAYIDREEAWRMYKPKVQAAVDSFTGLYTQAQSKNDSWEKALLFLKAHKTAEKEKLPSLLQFAFTLYPDSVDLYRQTEERFAGLPAEMHKTQKKCSFFIEEVNTAQTQLAEVTREILTQVGFVHAETDSVNHYRCTVMLDASKAVLPAGVFFTPSVSISVSSGTKTVFSYSKTLKRIGASTEHAAWQRMHAVICNHLRTALPQALLGLTETN